MKILFLNPLIDTRHVWVTTLRERGVAVLIAPNVQEAYQLLQLHGTSVDMAVIHREGADGKGDAGLGLIQKIKSDPKHSDLPYLVTTSNWSDAECATHQETPNGANAYLRTPDKSPALNDAKALIATIEAVLGHPIKADATRTQTMASAATSATIEAPVLMEVPQAPEVTGMTSGGIQLEAPVQESEAPVPEISTATPPPFLKPDEQNSTMGIEPVKSQVFEEMPYLTQDRTGISIPKAPELPPAAALWAGHSVQDAVIPGGVAQSPDLDTLKKYLLLREQDLVTLSAQFKTSQEKAQTAEAILKAERVRNAELEHLVQGFKERYQNLEQEALVAAESARKEADDLRFQLRSKTDKVAVMERKVRQSSEDLEALKERVRGDIRKIRIREKELENRLEILKKDSEVLITARENKIVELKRKLDVLEFNMDLLQDRYDQEKTNSRELQARLERAAQAMRVAGGFLDFQDEGQRGASAPSSAQEPRQPRETKVS